MFWISQKIYLQDNNGQKFYLQADSWTTKAKVSLTTNSDDATLTTLLQTAFKRLFFTLYNPSGKSLQNCAGADSNGIQMELRRKENTCYSDINVEWGSGKFFLKQGTRFICMDASSMKVKYQNVECDQTFNYGNGELVPPVNKIQTSTAQQTEATSSFLNQQESSFPHLNLQSSQEALMPSHVDDITMVIQPTSSIQVATVHETNLLSMDSLPQFSTPVLTSIVMKAVTLTSSFNEETPFSEIRHIKPTNVLPSSSKIRTTNRIVPAFKPGYYKVIGPWEKHNCPVKCKRSKTKKTRKCGIDYRWFEKPDDSICNESVEEEIECLDLSDCTGTRYYLATEGMSCGEFCLKSGSNGFSKHKQN